MSVRKRGIVMVKQVSSQILNALCKNCGERRNCRGICIEMNNAMVKAREIKATTK